MAFSAARFLIFEATVVLYNWFKMRFCVLIVNEIN